MHALSSDDIPEFEPLDDDTVAWADVLEATYMVHQRYRYDYPVPIADLHHRLMVVPRPKHGDQRRIASRLDVSPHAVTHDAFDIFGGFGELVLELVQQGGEIGSGVLRVGRVGTVWAAGRR